MADWMQAAQAAAAEMTLQETADETKRCTNRARYLAAFLGRKTWEDIVFKPYDNPYSTIPPHYMAEVDGYWFSLDGTGADEWMADRNRAVILPEKLHYLKMSHTSYSEPQTWERVSTLGEVGLYISKHPPPTCLPEPEVHEPEEDFVPSFLRPDPDEAVVEEEIVSERQRSRRWRR